MMGYLEDTPYRINQDMTNFYLNFRKRNTDRSIWNEALRTASFYTCFPYFTTKMLQKFSAHKDEINELKHFSEKFKNDKVYEETSTFWKKYMDRQFIERDTDYLSGEKLSKNYRMQRKNLFEKIHHWQLGNSNSENGLHIKNEGIIDYLVNLPEQRYWNVSFADFRGRLYQYGIWNPTGTKFNRSMLYFDNVCKVDERAKYWMFVHAANSAGWNDKQSNQVRYETALAKVDMIREIAKDPLKHIKKWENLDAPWQCVSTFIEIDKILTAEEKGEEAHFTGIPIFQDGSCNGLQHYAALGKDPSIAGMVNLTDGEKPHDIYSVIANRLDKRANQDLDNGIYDGLSKSLIEKVKKLFVRSIVKRPIMTLPYGSTE